jgi:hypothetical protein
MYLTNLVKNDKSLLDAKITNIVNTVLTKTRINAKRVNFYPSDALCSRKHYLESNIEYESESSPILTYSAVIGNATETMLIENLLNYNSDFVYAYDLSISSKTTGFDASEWLNYSGKIDLILNIDDQLILCDIKTYGKELRLEQYTAQLQFYAAVTGLENAAILAFSRNLVENGQFAFKYIPIDVSNDAKINAITVAFYAQLCYDANVLPHKPKKFRKTVECKYCYFKQACWDDTLDFKNDPNDELLKTAKELATEFVNEPFKLKRFLNMVERTHK